MSDAITEALDAFQNNMNALKLMEISEDHLTPYNRRHSMSTGIVEYDTNGVAIEGNLAYLYCTETNTLLKHGREEVIRDLYNNKKDQYDAISAKMVVLPKEHYKMLNVCINISASKWTKVLDDLVENVISKKTDIPVYEPMYKVLSSDIIDDKK